MSNEIKKDSLTVIGEVRTLCSYLKTINKIIKDNNGSVLAYRGHFDEKYKLIPSIGRDGYSEQKEKDIFNKFCSQYHSFTDIRYDKDMDLLFLAQHYGLPTRLLDWTLNPLIALFFSCYSENNKQPSNGEVIINVIAKDNGKDVVLLRDNKNENPFSGNMSARLIIPDYTDSRLINQRAAFTLFNKPDEEMKIKGYKITVNHKASILKELDAIGIKLDFVYPTLDRLCERLKSEINTK